ncbi:MAG: hypothetical protein HQ474_08075 [Flammeovirgaceae bacterium]|jgi:hypothetical protein|nr:hypothetical protein [Flammeovirgaceae bacterium]
MSSLRSGVPLNHYNAKLDRSEEGRYGLDRGEVVSEGTMVVLRISRTKPAYL